MQKKIISADGQVEVVEMSAEEIEAQEAFWEQVSASSEVRTVSTYDIVKRIEALGKSEEAVAILEQYPVLKARFYTVGRIKIDDPNTLMLLQAIGVDPAVVLAPGD